MKIPQLNLSILNSRKAFYLAFGAVILIFAAFTACMSLNADFIAINGLFQNYNVARRFLDGQVPYRDFPVYLGLGHLWIGSLFTWIFGGSFGDSVMAFNILASLLFPLFVFSACRCVFRYNAAVPILLSLLVLCIYGMRGIDSVMNLISRIVVAGNSARGIRGMVLPVSAAMACLWIWLLRRHFLNSQPHPVPTLIGLACIMGLAFCWGNDYGVCCYIAMLFTILVVVFTRTRSWRHLAGASALLLAISAIFIVLWATLLSKGHFLLWLHGNFTAANYQGWYFNMPTQHPYYYYQLDYHRFVIFAFVLSGYYFYRLIKGGATHAACMRYGFLGYCNLTAFGAATEYRLFGGGGSPLREVLCFVVLISLCIEIIHFAMESYKKDPERFHKGRYRYTAVILAALICLGGISSFAVTVGKNAQQRPQLTYFKALDGNFDEMYKDVSDLETFLSQHPGRLFSFYASVAETITGQFQPSGTDYIIHVLSDEGRSAYLQSLKEDRSGYVTTPLEDYTNYGTWIRNANWFAYREVYRDYRAVYKNSYQTFWQYAGPDAYKAKNISIDVSIKEVEPSQSEIYISAPGVASGIADVRISYQSQSNGGLRARLMHTMIVGVTTNAPMGEGTLQNFWSLRPVSDEYIPVEIKDGKGYAVLSTYPRDNTEIHVKHASCDTVILPQHKINRSDS